MYSNGLKKIQIVGFVFPELMWVHYFEYFLFHGTIYQVITIYLLYLSHTPQPDFKSSMNYPQGDLPSSELKNQVQECTKECKYISFALQQ